MKTFHTEFGVSMIYPNCVVLLAKTQFCFSTTWNLDSNYLILTIFVTMEMPDGNKILLIYMATLI